MLFGLIGICFAQATHIILAAYSQGSEPSGLSVGLCNFNDQIGDKIGVFKKKMSFRVDDATEITENVGDTAASQLEKLKMCFAGRLVAIPVGQPATAFKAKLTVESEFFKKLGHEAFIVPVSKHDSPDMAIKSPLCCPAWQVKTRNKDTNVKIDHIQVQIEDKFDLGGAIDLKLPILVAGSGGREISKVKVMKGDKEIRFFGFDLYRPFTDLESADEKARAAHKTKQEDLKKRKAAALEETFSDVDGDGADDDGRLASDEPDRQIYAPAMLLKRVLN